MVGSTGNYTPTAESTTDGITMDTTSVPDFDVEVHGSCLVTVNETTIISFGGNSPANSKKIAIYTIGNSQWEVRLTIPHAG